MPKKYWVNYKNKNLTIEDLSNSVGGGVSYSFENGPSVSANINAGGKMLLGQLKTAGLFTQSIDITQNMLKNKLSLGLSINSPFQNRRIEHSELISSQFERYSYYSAPQRSFFVRANYNFGGRNSSSNRKNNKNVVNDDMK